MGSSPLTRGKPHNFGCDVRDAGLIPAHAGKTASMTLAGFLSAAHPRSRGENAEPDGLVDVAAGSSPLTRGKRVCGSWGRGRARLIPAHAGKTGVFCMLMCTTPAHPRSRGENKMRARELGTDTGSSPLTRGKRGNLEAAITGGRLIPAHAGKTSCRLSAFLTPQAHPRSRGENSAN